METVTAFLVLCVSVFMRLALPIAITLVLVYFLRRLDARWQRQVNQGPLPVRKPECWRIRGRSPEQCKSCIAFSSPVPCWQVFRLPNGYLCEECISCEVFIHAPSPALKLNQGECKV